MRKAYGLSLACVFLFASSLCGSQVPGFSAPSGERIASDTALDRALKTSSLTYNGKPFHAMLEIGSAGSSYSGSVEVWWLASGTYRIATKSPSFSQLKIVNGSQIQETDEGDYYPRWLENFVLALVNPLPTEKNFRSGNGAVTIGPQITRACLGRNDRPGGITDDMTWGEVCFNGDEPKLSEVLTMNQSMQFSDWQGFAGKKIARSYETDVLSYQPVKARLVTLEALKSPDKTLFVVAIPTPPAQQIGTSFVSTLKEESLLEKAPDLHWPSVRDGKTEGYMIVYARTDRSGQVRESAKHNSDNAELEKYGMEQALNYKFKPLIVDGVSQQMEMPLVLHFVSRLDDPYPILSGEALKKQILSCNPPALSTGTLPKGAVLVMRLTIDETGKLVTINPLGSMPGLGRAFLALVPTLYKCKFAPYSVNGKVTTYKGDLQFTAP